MVGALVLTVLRVESWLIGCVVALLDVPHYDAAEEQEQEW